MKQAGKRRRFADGARVVCVAPASACAGEAGEVTFAGTLSFEEGSGMQHFTVKLDLNPESRVRFSERELDPETGDRRLNLNEAKVINTLLLAGAEMKIAALSEAAFFGIDECHTTLESWVRNALRRLVRYRWALKVGPGAYRASQWASSLHLGGWAWDTVRARMKTRRQQAGLSQAALAKRLGVSRGWVAHREQGVAGKAIYPADVHRLAWALGCHPTSLARNNR